MSYRVVSGQKIKEIRDRKALSLQDVADLAGNVFDRIALHHWENGNARPRDKNLHALMDALECDWEDISETYAEQVKSAC